MRHIVLLLLLIRRRDVTVTRLLSSLLLYARCRSRSEVLVLGVAPVLLLRHHAIDFEVLVLERVSGMVKSSEG